MATCIAMEFNPTKLIDTYTPERLSDVSGIPPRTIYRWRQLKAVPGKGVAKQWRIDQLKAAAATLRKAAQQVQA